MINSSIAPLVASWFDFADHWGNTASLIGLVVAIFAFPITWNIQKRIQREITKTLENVGSLMLSSSLEDLHRYLLSASEAARNSIWLRVVDNCMAAKNLALRLKSHAALADEEQMQLRENADNLTQVIRYLERNKLRRDNPSMIFDDKKRLVIDNMLACVNEIQGRLEAKMWENASDFSR